MRHSRRRRPIAWLACTLFMSTHLVSLLMLRRCASGSTQLCLNVWTVLDVLPKVADVTAELLVWLERERYDGNEAEGEPFPALHWTSGEVTAVLALEGQVLGTGKAGCKG